MVDGSEYNVKVPPGVEPGHKFLAVFPTAPMRAAAAQRLGRQPAGHDLDAFLSAVEGGGGAGAGSGGGREGGEEVDDLAAALAASKMEADHRAAMAQQDEDQLKQAMLESAVEAEDFAE